MSAELSGHLAGWEPVQNALDDVRAAHGDCRQFFSQVFDQLGTMLSDLAGRKNRWDSERRQTESELSRQAAQLQEDRATLAARQEQHSPDAPAAAENIPHLQRLLEEAQRGWAEMREAQQAVHAQIAQLADTENDVQLAQLLEEIRQQRAELRGAQQASQAQVEQLAAVAAELTEVRFELTQKTSSPGDDRLAQMLEEIRQQRAELRGAQQTSQAQAEQLAAVAAELTAARGKLSEAQDEIARRWEQFEARRAEAEQPPFDGELQNRLQQMEREQTLLERERIVLESELEAVRNRAAEMAETLADQKGQAAAQRAEWADELKRMRRLLETISGRLAAGETAGRTPSADLQQPGAVAAARSSLAADSDPILDSVAAQFEMLQRDLARRRAARPETQAVS